MDRRLRCLYLFRSPFVPWHFGVEVLDAEELILGEGHQSLQFFRSELNRYFGHRCIKLNTKPCFAADGYPAGVRDMKVDSWQFLFLWLQT